jgi:hypothetical protein
MDTSHSGVSVAYSSSCGCTVGTRVLLTAGVMSVAAGVLLIAAVVLSISADAAPIMARVLSTVGVRSVTVDAALVGCIISEIFVVACGLTTTCMLTCLYDTRVSWVSVLMRHTWHT